MIIYVNAVAESLAFYQEAFGFETRFLHESGDYGELETGNTVLAFASYELASSNVGDIPVGYENGDQAVKFEIALVTGDVEAAITQAVNAGAKPVKQAEQKPWGQTVGYVRSPEGTLIELCTPVNGDS